MNALHYSFPLGDFRCAALSDGFIPSAARTFFANAPEAELAEALRRHGVPDDSFPAPLHPLLIRTATECILVDAGVGPGVAPTAGRLPESLTAAGIQPEDVTIVLLTHAHADHAGGAVDANGCPAFPNARYLMSDQEARFWLSDPRAGEHDGPRAMAARRLLTALEGRLENVDPAQEVVSGVAVLAAPGHTPFATAVQVESRGRRLLYVADAIAHPIHVEHPDWHLKPDFDLETANHTRRGLIERAAADGSLIHGYHFPMPPLGVIRRNGSFRFERQEPG